MTLNLHEELYRGRPLLQRLESCAIRVCGAGALGANLTESLVRCGARSLEVIDRDRVEEHNLSTQPYGRGDIGGQKAQILSHSLYRATGVAVTAHPQELTSHNVKRLLRGADLVVDCFDNTDSRQLLTNYCGEAGMQCLHLGLSADFAEVLWNDVYRVPGQTGPDGCDYPLARSIVQLAVATACEVIFAFLESEVQRSFTITLADLSIRPFS